MTNEETRRSVVTGLDMEGERPTISFDGAPPVPLAEDDSEEGPEAQRQAYRDVLRIGDEVEWALHPLQEDQIGWVRHPRPTIDRITLDWLLRKGFTGRQLAEAGRRHATIWHPPTSRDFMVRHGSGEDEKIATLDNWKGEIRLGLITAHPAMIELRGPYLIFDATQAGLPLSVLTGMLGDAMAGRPIEDLIDGVREHCGMTGMETIRSITVRDDDDFGSTVVHLVSDQPVPLADL